MSKHLTDERPLILLPTVAKLIGLNEAIVLNQIHFLLQLSTGGRIIDGEKWIWNTFEQWQQEHFPFWSVRTVKSTFKKLQEFGALLSCQPDGRMSRKKYYRLDPVKISGLRKHCTIDSATSARSDSAASARSVTETSAENSETETSKESKGTSFASQSDGWYSSPDIPATWIPSARRQQSKERQLAKLPVPKNYPSEDTFDAFIEANECYNIANCRDLYKDLSVRKWHDWNRETGRWTPIRDWKKYVLALETKMRDATGS